MQLVESLAENRIKQLGPGAILNEHLDNSFLEPPASNNNFKDQDDDVLGKRPSRRIESLALGLENSVLKSKSSHRFSLDRCHDLVACTSRTEGPSPLSNQQGIIAVKPLVFNAGNIFALTRPQRKLRGSVSAQSRVSPLVCEDSKRRRHQRYDVNSIRSVRANFPREVTKILQRWYFQFQIVYPTNEQKISIQTEIMCKTSHILSEHQLTTYFCNLRARHPIQKKFEK